MSFESKILDIPEDLTTSAFVLRPISGEDAEIDFAAVMESKDFLRPWEQTGWPEDDFTVADNRKDLEKLEWQHASRERFTYTVVNPNGDECLGCVYINPTDVRWLASAQIIPVGDRHWGDFDAVVYFWIRASHLETGTDRVLLGALRTWLDQKWPFRGCLFATSEYFTQQVGMFENAGLKPRFEIKERNKPGRSLAYE